MDRERESLESRPRIEIKVVVARVLLSDKIRLHKPRCSERVSTARSSSFGHHKYIAYVPIYSMSIEGTISNNKRTT